MASILPNKIAQADHLRSIDELVEERFKNIGLYKMMVYFVDTVSADALPYLAKQFGVDGFKGFVQATTEDEKRALIKKAISLQKAKGTVWAIKEAIRVTGMSELVTIKEGYPDHWAKFMISADFENYELLSSRIEELADLVNAYKPARCVYVGMELSDVVFEETQEFEESFGEIVAELPMTDSQSMKGLLYDGTWNYDGSKKYEDENDELIINIQYI